MGQRLFQNFSSTCSSALSPGTLVKVTTRSPLSRLAPKSRLSPLSCVSLTAHTLATPIAG